MPNGTDNSLDKIQEQYSFIANSVFYNIYKEFDKTCKDYQVDHQASCPKGNLAELNPMTNVTDLLKKLYSNLYRVYVSSETVNNDYFPDYLDEVKKIGCICLKYWLYDQIVSRGLSESEIKQLFNEYQNYINGKTQDIRENYCNFNELSLNHINKLRNIYAFYTTLYDNANNFETCYGEQCKYIDYFGEGLDEFINGINNCTNNLQNKNYCNELNEFIEMCKKDNEYAGISIYEENTKSKAETAKKYFLSSERYKETQLYIYLKNEELLNFVNTSHFISTKNRTTIAATSVVGSAIGLSSIFFYFYKFTPFGSSLRKGKGKNIVNVDEGAQDALLYTSDTEKTPFQSRKYNVAYHTFSDT